VADIVAFNIEAVEADLPVSSAMLLAPIVDIGLNADPSDLNVVAQLHCSLLAQILSLTW
jgi:hypothetical protein